MRAPRFTNHVLPGQAAYPHKIGHCLAQNLLYGTPFLNGEHLQPFPPAFGHSQGNARKIARSSVGTDASGGRYHAGPFGLLSPLPLPGDRFRLCFQWPGLWRRFGLRRLGGWRNGCRADKAGETALGWPRHQAASSRTANAAAVVLIFEASRPLTSFQSFLISRAALLAGSNSPTA